MTDNQDPVIVAVTRTPFGRLEGALVGVPAPRLAAWAIDEALQRAGKPPIDAVYAGIGLIGSATLTATRQAVLLSSLPHTTPSFGVDRACCSGMTAIGLGWKDILAGQSESLVCGGFESLSRTPLLWPRQRPRIGTVSVEDPLRLSGPAVDRPIAVYSGEEALRQGVSRVDQDSWAVASHSNYFAAQERGFFAFERMALTLDGPKGQALVVDADESPRRDTTLEKLSRLSPVYGGPCITAGNAPGLNDGAAFVVLVSANFARTHGLKALARVRGYAQVCGDATSGTYTPAVAIDTLLQKQGLTIDGIDQIEINEAYAATPLVSTLHLGGGDPARVAALRKRTNIHGGAVAIGHPLGASGARLTMTLIAGLRERGGGRGVAAICGGFGQGDALLVEVDA